jgi:hypothetical protein
LLAVSREQGVDGRVNQPIKSGDGHGDGWVGFATGAAARQNGVWHF